MPEQANKPSYPSVGDQTSPKCFDSYVSEPEFLQNFIKLRNLAGLAQVNFSLNYQDCDHQWFIDITSSIPSEEHMTRDYPLSIALEDAIEHLEKLLKPKKA